MILLMLAGANCLSACFSNKIAPECHVDEDCLRRAGLEGRWQGQPKAGLHRQKDG